MEIQQLLHADYLDILFDHRNKSYGGYELRRHYSNRATKATLITLLATGILCSYSFLHHSNHTSAITLTLDKGNTLTDLSKRIYTPPPPKMPAPVHQPTATPVHTATFTHPVITNDIVKPNELLSTNDKLKDAVAGTHDASGTAATSAPAGDGTAHTLQPPGPPKPVTWVEQMPEFAGNFDSYIISHIRYPESARSANITGRVIVRFVVNEDGTISDAKVIQGIGGGCDEEALRVINGMPKWKPGRQNGQAVKVYCSVPINFLLQ